MVATSSMLSSKKITQKKSFAQVLHDSYEVQVSQFPSLMIKGDSLCIKITQEENGKGLANCRRNLHGGVLSNKGDKPLTARDLRMKLTSIWISCSVNFDFVGFKITDN
jgi:hypothetical protein